MLVDFEDLFDGRGFEEGGGDALFDPEDYAFAGCYLSWGPVSILAIPCVCLWVVYTPIAVDPSLMASREYSTWKRRPSGENVLFKDLISGLNYSS